MTDGREPNNHGSINWEQLEAELRPAEDRANAIHLNQIEQTAADIKDVVLGLIPDGLTFDPIVRQHPDLAADGKPMVVTYPEMLAITREDPSIAELVGRIVDWNTLAKRQQLALDVWDATKANDTEALEHLEEVELKIDEEAYYYEIFTILSALHPFSRSYVKEHITSHPGDAGSIDEQVWFMVHANQEIDRLSKMLRDNNPRYIDYWRSEAVDDPVRLESYDYLEKHMEERAVELANYRKIINDVITGEAAIEYDFEEPPTPPTSPEVSQEAIEAVPFYDILKNLPGLEPISYVTTGRLKDLPRSGWIIQSKVSMADSGGMDIFRFEEGGMRLEGIYGRVGGETTGASFEFGSDKYSHYMLSYQRKDKETTYNGLTSSKDQIVELSDDKVLRSSPWPMRSYGSDITYWTSFHHEDIDTQIEYQLQRPSSKPITVELNRVTDDLDTLKEIVSDLGSAMGLNQDELDGLIEVLQSKDVFSGVKHQTDSEKAQQEAYWKRDKIISGSESGTVVEDYKGNRFFVEPDGSRWISYSASSGLSYMGPDDGLGYYNE